MRPKPKPKFPHPQRSDKFISTSEKGDIYERGFSDKVIRLLRYGPGPHQTKFLAFK